MGHAKQAFFVVIIITTAISAIYFNYYNVVFCNLM